METLQLITAHWPVDRSRLLAIRHAVFVDEQGVPAEFEEDPQDPLAYHCAALSGDGEWIGTGRLLDDGHIGRLAVLQQHRGQGVGSALLAHLIDQAQARGHRQLALSSQIAVADFYQRFGFVRHGEVYDEVGIPHIAMTRPG